MKTVKEISDYLESFMIASNWLDEHVPERARAIFTSMCLIGNIDADDYECDNTLMHLYDVAAMEDVDITYEEFESFMVKFIV